MLKVIYLPHVLRRDYFNSLLNFALQEEEWRVGAVCSKSSRKFFTDFVGKDDFFFLPNFSRIIPSSEQDFAIAYSLMKDCEMISGISTNRILLQAERDVGRGFSIANYYWQQRRDGKIALRDNEFPLRYLASVFLWCQGVLESFSPDFVLAGGSTPTSNFIFSLLAERKGIPFIIGRASKLLSNRSFWTVDRFMFNSDTSERYRALENKGSAVSPESLEFVENFRKRPTTIDYIQGNWQKGSETWAKYCRDVFGAAGNLVLHLIRGKQGLPPLPLSFRIIHYPRKKYLDWRQRRFFKMVSAAELMEMKYVLFPMHREPELTLNFQAHAWHDQRHTVKRLCSVLPVGYKLLVREHRFNQGMRPTHYYKEILSLPNVILIHPLDDQFKYVANADLIVTENGSSGWEGLILCRSVITLDRTFYDAPELTVKVNSFTRLNQAVLEALQAKDLGGAGYDERLGRLVDAEFASTVSDENSHAGSLEKIYRLLEAEKTRFTPKE